jgi:hypothetical protein
VVDRCISGSLLGGLFSSRRSVSNSNEGGVSYRPCISNGFVCVYIWNDILQSVESNSVVYTAFHNSLTNFRYLEKREGIGMRGSLARW